MIFLKIFVGETEWIGIGLAKMMGIIIYVIVLYCILIFRTKNDCAFYCTRPVNDDYIREIQLEFVRFNHRVICQSLSISSLVCPSTSVSLVAVEVGKNLGYFAHIILFLEKC